MGGARCAQPQTTVAIGAQGPPAVGGQWLCSSKLCDCCLQGDVAVLLPRVALRLALQHLQVLADTQSCGAGLDNVVNKASAGRGEWVGESRHILILALLQSLRVLLAAIDDGHGTLGAHDSNLSCGPGVVDVTAQVLAAHDIVGTAVRLARDPM